MCENKLMWKELLLIQKVYKVFLKTISLFFLCTLKNIDFSIKDQYNIIQLTLNYKKWERIIQVAHYFESFKPVGRRASSGLNIL